MLPELAAIVLAVATAIAMLVSIVRLGMPQLAVPLAMPQALTVLLGVTAAWVVARARTRWWLPLVAIVLFAIMIAVLAAVGSGTGQGGYLWLLPWLAVVVLVVVVVYALLGVLGSMSAERGGRGAWTWASFALLVAGAPAWAATMLTLTVLDTAFEDAVALPQLLTTALQALVAVAGSGLAAARSRAGATTGAILLSLLAIVALADLLAGAEAWSRVVLVLGIVAAAATAWMRAMRLPSSRQRAAQP